MRWTIGFPAGGSTDTLVRIMAEWLQTRLGQTVLVENKSGAGSNIATEAVINAPPDGYTLAAVTSANAINATISKRTLTFDFLKDLAPVAGLAQGPSVMVVHPSVPANSVAEFVAYARANPGKINMGTPGMGTTGHMAGELFKAMAGVDLVHVPYRGSAPAVTDLIGGQVQVMFDAMVSTLPQIQSGKIRALAVTTATRSAVLPNVPAIAETVPGYEAIIWYGVGVPRGTPTEVVGKAEPRDQCRTDVGKNEVAAVRARLDADHCQPRTSSGRSQGPKPRNGKRSSGNRAPRSTDFQMSMPAGELRPASRLEGPSRDGSCRGPSIETPSLSGPSG